MFHPIAKTAAVLGVAAALTAAVADSSYARNRWVGPAVGFGAGVIVGSALANSNRYYGPGPYAYDPNYYGPAYYGPNYYEPAPVYVAPGRAYGQCWVTTDRDRGYGYYRPC